MPGLPMSDTGLTNRAFLGVEQAVQNHTGTVVVTIAEMLVAVHTVAELAVSPETEIVFT